MTDNGDGTYSYSFSIARPGIITVAIKLNDSSGVYWEYFANTNLAGSVMYTDTRSNINIPMGYQDIYPGRAVDVSAYFYFSFKAPITGTITFSIEVDYTIKMYISNTILLMCKIYKIYDLNIPQNPKR